MSMYSECYLSHYGVKGMKWGVRRDRLNDKIAAGEAKRATLAEKKGITSKSYRKASRDLYELKARRDIASAKADGDKKRIAATKLDYSFAKDIKKNGTESGISYTKAIKRAVYGEHLTDKQIKALADIDSKEFIRKYKAKQGMKVAAGVLATIGSASVTAIAKSRT